MRRQTLVGFCTGLSLMLALVTPVFSGGSQEVARDDHSTLRVAWWGGEARHEATINALNAYDAATPDVSIEAEFGGWTGYYEQLVTQLAGGNAADVVQIDQPWIYDLYAEGHGFVNLHDYSEIIDLDGFDREFLRALAEVNGDLQGLPSGVNGYALFWNETLAREHGIDTSKNWTWEELIRVGEQFNRENPGHYFLHTVPSTISTVLEIIVKQITGDHFFTPDGSYGFTQDQLTRGFELVGTMLDRNVIPPFADTALYSAGGQEEYPPWVQGRILGQIAYVSVFPLIESVTDFELSVGRLPVFDGATSTGVFVRPSQLLSVTASSDHVEKSVSLLNWLLTSSDAALHLVDSRGVPANAVARQALVENGLLHPIVNRGMEIVLENAGQPQTTLDVNRELASIREQIVEEYGFGSYSATEAAARLIRLSDEVIRELQ